MKISTKGRYALEVAVDLAMHSSPQQLESIKNIAARRKLSEKYLERIIGLLKKAEIVTSTRGSKGGYYLSKSPAEITVYDILIAAEGTLAPVECLVKSMDCGIDCEKCPTRNVWNRMWSIIKDSVKDTHLDELIPR